MVNISYSRISSYMSCPYQHYLSYEIGVKAKKPARPLYFGSDFHSLLEVRNDPNELKKVKEEIRNTYYEIPSRWQSDLGLYYVEDLLSIFEDYCDVYKDSQKPSITEKEFNIDLFEHKGEIYVFKGFIDEVYKRRSKAGEKYIKIGEHKTFNQRPTMLTLVMNTQKNLYAKAVEILYGMMPKSVIWDYIHSKPAMEPIWLEKSKRFSTQKSKLITPYSWLRACRAHDITDKETLARAEEFRGNIPNYFFRVEQDYDPKMVESVWQGFLYQAKLIARYGRKNTTKNMNRNCSYCQYQNICYTQLTGGNIYHVIEREYIIAPRDDILTEERRAYDPLFADFMDK